MKTLLIILLLIVILIGAGYFGLPILIERETAGLRSEVQDVKQRLQKMEQFTKVAPLQPNADFQGVIKTVNAIYSKMISLEASLNKSTSAIDERIKGQKTATEEALKKQEQATDKVNAETEAKIQEIMFDATMANIRGHILKARVEIASKNVGTAKSELELIDELFSKAAEVTSDKNKEAIRDLQAYLKKARTEIDTDLPAALHRIDLLWHEMSKLLIKT